jgi:hypothetical protein
VPRAALPLIFIGVLVAAPSLATTGSLSVESQPGVEVVWDGTSLGRTAADGTMQIDRIPPGEYVLELSKAGYQSQRLRVVITEERATIRGFLESVAPDRPPAPPTAAPRPQTAPPPELPGDTAPLQSSPTAASPQPPPVREAPASVRTQVEGAPPPVEVSTAPEAGPTLDVPGSGALDDQESEGLPLGQLFLVLGITVIGGLAIFLAGRRKPSVVAAQAPPVAESRVEKTVSVVGDDNRFIENLRARERAMDGSSHDVQEIIDVEFIDIQEVEGDA